MAFEEICVLIIGSEKLKFSCESVYLLITKLRVALSKVINIAESIASIDSFRQSAAKKHKYFHMT